MDLKFTSPFPFLDDYLIEYKKEGDFSVNEINLMGGRWTGKTASLMIFFIKLIQQNPETYMELFCVRKSVGKVGKLMDQMIDFWPKELKYKSRSNKSLGIFEFNDPAGFWKLRFVGLPEKKKKGTMSKLGEMRSQKTELVVVFFEEAFEISGREKIDILTAITPTAKTRLILSASNPWDPYSDFYQTVFKYAPYEYQTMRTKGELFYRLKKRPTSKKDSVFHWICPMWFKINPEKSKTDGFSISEDTFELIEDELDRYPSDRDVILYGKPAPLAGGIYVNAMRGIHWVDERGSYNQNKWLSKVFQNGSWRFGIDFGFGNARTVVEITGLSEDKTKVLNFDELVIETREEDILSQSKKVIVFLKNFLRKIKGSLMDREKIGLSGRVLVMTDIDGGTGIIKILKILAKKENLKLKFVLGKTNFQKSGKKNAFLIRDRIIAHTFAMSAGSIYWVIGKCPLLHSEMERSRWIMNDKRELIRSPAFDDAINAFEYSISDVFFKIGNFVKD